jgi:hypothetical protein
MVYNFNGKVNIQASLIACLQNLDGLMSPGYEDWSQVNVSAQLILNNLIQINELQNTVTLGISMRRGQRGGCLGIDMVWSLQLSYLVDFFVKLEWIDPRLNMPDLWEAVHQKQGDKVTYGEVFPSNCVDRRDGFMDLFDFYRLFN